MLLAELPTGIRLGPGATSHIHVIRRIIASRHTRKYCITKPCPQSNMEGVESPGADGDSGHILIVPLSVLQSYGDHPLLNSFLVWKSARDVELDTGIQATLEHQ